MIEQLFLHILLLGEETSPREVFDAPEGSPPKSPSKGQVRSPSRSPLKSRSDSTINSEEDVDGM